MAVDQPEEYLRQRYASAISYYWTVAKMNKRAYKWSRYLHHLPRLGGDADCFVVLCSLHQGVHDTIWYPHPVPSGVAHYAQRFRSELSMGSQLARNGIGS